MHPGRLVHTGYFPPRTQLIASGTLRLSVLLTHVPRIVTPHPRMRSLSTAKYRGRSIPPSTLDTGDGDVECAAGRQEHTHDEDPVLPASDDFLAIKDENRLRSFVTQTQVRDVRASPLGHYYLTEAYSLGKRPVSKSRFRAFGVNRNHGEFACLDGCIQLQAGKPGTDWGQVTLVAASSFSICWHGAFSASFFGFHFDRYGRVKSVTISGDRPATGPTLPLLDKSSGSSSMDWEEIYTRIKTNPDDSDAYLQLEEHVKRWARKDLWIQGVPAVHDATTDTCEIVVLNIERARSRATFRGFVIGHYFNVRKRYFRQKPDIPIDNVTLCAPDPPDPDDAAMAALHKCLEKLRSREKEAIRMKFWGDCSYHEIAEKLSVRLGNARRIAFNGVQSLRDCVAASLAIASNIGQGVIP